MAFVSFELALGHLRASAGDEDDWIELHLQAAQQSAVDYLNRQVFESQEALVAAKTAGTAGEYPMVVNAAIQAAILKTLGELYANREDSVVAVSVAELPFGAKSLLRPHRISPGV